MNLRWFVSRKVRMAGAMRKHVQKILCAQRDLLSAPAIGAVETAIAGLKSAAAGADDEALKKQMANLEEVANKWLKPYPNAAIRENVEVLLVALAVAHGNSNLFRSAVQDSDRLDAANAFWCHSQSWHSQRREPARLADSRAGGALLRLLDQRQFLFQHRRARGRQVTGGKGARALFAV